MEKRLFFQVATDGLGKYCTDGYGQIGVYIGRCIYFGFDIVPDSHINSNSQHFSIGT